MEKDISKTHGTHEEETLPPKSFKHQVKGLRFVRDKSQSSPLKMVEESDIVQKVERVRLRNETDFHT